MSAAAAAPAPTLLLFGAPIVIWSCMIARGVCQPAALALQLGLQRASLSLQPCRVLRAATAPASPYRHPAAPPTSAAAAAMGSAGGGTNGGGSGAPRRIKAALIDINGASNRTAEDLSEEQAVSVS